MSRGDAFLERLDSSVLLGDGAMGTRLYTLGVPLQVSYELMNVDRPDLVRRIHGEYIEAGAEVIETNTYQANRVQLRSYGLDDRTAELVRAGARLAREEAGDDVFVAGSVGPLNLKPEEVEDEDVDGIYRETILALAEEGVDVLFLETFYALEELEAAHRVARAETDLPVVCMMATMEAGRTPRGVDVVAASRRMAELGADAYGTNCGKGAQQVVEVCEELASVSPLPIVGFPNAGFPQFLDGRYHYLATPEYMGRAARDLVEAGATLIGGCCGTDPDDIGAMKQAIEGLLPAPRVTVEPPEADEEEEAVPPLGGDAPWLGKRTDELPPLLVEFDPPKKMDLERTLRKTKILARKGVEAITIGDCPLAKIRMSNLAFGHVVETEADVPVINHLACRDRNLIGLQGYVMGAHALGFRSILALTGDPAKIGNQPGATSVYDLNSFGLIEMLEGFNRGVNLLGHEMAERTAFSIGVAFNPNGIKIDGQLRRLERKADLGAHFAMTQPVYDPDRIREMKERTDHVDLPIFLGVLPLVSERNARFIHNEVPGIDVTEEALERLDGKSGKEGRLEGLRMAEEVIEMAWDLVHGFYLIPSFERLDIACHLVEFVQDRATRLGLPASARDAAPARSPEVADA